MVAAAIVLLAAIGIHLALQIEDVRQLSRLSPGVAIGSLVLLLASHLAQNESMLLPLRVHLPRIGFWELFLVRTGGLVFGSAVPVAGGPAVRLAYLYRQGLSVAQFTHATVLSNALAIVAAACLALPATAVLWAMAGAPPAAVLALTLGVLALGGAALALLQALPHIARYRRLSRWLPAVEELSVSRSMVIRTFVVSVLRHATSFVAFGWLYAALSGVPGSFVAGGLVYAFTTPVRMVNLTPGNLGVNEWATAIAGRALAFDVTTGLLVGGVFRAASMAAQGVGVLAGWMLAESRTPSARRP
ncbi:MAG TPA: lysylphosphatidylglycerol synthase domain-containing protein [Vicinamibacterales bacterium]